MAFGFKKSADAPAHVEWPAINELVWLRLPCCEVTVHPSRVEDVIDGDLVIAAPSKPHQSPVPPPVRPFVLGWRVGVASMQVKAEFVSAQDLVVPTWTLHALSAAEMLQRRRFFRVHWDREITCYLPTIGGPVTGRIVDLSEGGVRCVLPETNEPRTSTFEVGFEVDGVPLVLNAQIVWWGEPVNGHVTVAFEFAGNGNELADRLRKLAFSAQLEERRKHRL